MTSQLRLKAALTIATLLVFSGPAMALSIAQEAAPMAPEMPIPVLESDDVVTNLIPDSETDILVEEELPQETVFDVSGARPDCDNCRDGSEIFTTSVAPVAPPLAILSAQDDRHDTDPFAITAEATDNMCNYAVFDIPAICDPWRAANK